MKNDNNLWVAQWTSDDGRLFQKLDKESISSVLELLPYLFQSCKLMIPSLLLSKVLPNADAWYTIILCLRQQDTIDMVLSNDSGMNQETSDSTCYFTICPFLFRSVMVTTLSVINILKNRC